MDMSEYDGTPSFYTNEDTFEKYLGQTSYYMTLQNSVVEIVSHVDPDRITELGSGTGETTIRLADEFTSAEILGIDNRESVTEISRDNLDELDLPNLTFETADMREHVQDSLTEMVVMLYSFHHIPDPLGQKVEFLEDCYETLPDGGYLCIAETFLKTDARNELADREIRSTWADRGLEGYASSFWAALDGLSPDDIEHAQDVGEFSRQHEREAGENVRTRDEEYLITMDWVVEHARSVGFDVVLAEPVNSLGDGIVLLQE